MPLAAGQTIPDVALTAITDDGPVEMDRDTLFNGKSVVLFAVPGAFTPTCSNDHLPGFIRHAGSIKAKGIDTIAVLAVNDHHVMSAWREASGAGNDVLFLADGSALFTKAVDMMSDSTAFGMGIRSQRYAAIIKNGTVSHVSVESKPGQAIDSGAQAVLAMLDTK
jgi:peroxiredoxin